MQEIAAAKIVHQVLPEHLAIIMDGNGRWAEQRRLPRVAGHKEGAEAVRRTVRACGEIGIHYLTLFAFSSENWKRPEKEVSDLMGLLRIYLKTEIAELCANNVRLQVIGESDALAADIRRLIDEAEDKTRCNTGMVLTIALNYGGQAEIVRAARALAADYAAGAISLDDINEETLNQYLYTKGLPDPDLLIRTSGEQRLSNFLLWQSAYTELLFVDEYWPDFNRDSLVKALQSFAARDRRFGARKVSA